GRDGRGVGGAGTPRRCRKPSAARREQREGGEQPTPPSAWPVRLSATAIARLVVKSVKPIVHHRGACCDEFQLATSPWRGPNRVRGGGHRSVHSSAARRRLGI